MVLVDVEWHGRSPVGYNNTRPPSPSLGLYLSKDRAKRAWIPKSGVSTNRRGALQGALQLLTSGLYARNLAETGL